MVSAKMSLKCMFFFFMYFEYFGETLIEKWGKRRKPGRRCFEAQKFFFLSSSVFIVVYPHPLYALPSFICSIYPRRLHPVLIFLFSSTYHNINYISFIFLFVSLLSFFFTYYAYNHYHLVHMHCYYNHSHQW